MTETIVLIVFFAAVGSLMAYLFGFFHRRKK